MVDRRKKVPSSHWETVKCITMVDNCSSIDKNVSLEDAVIEAEQWMEENSSSNAFMDNWKPNTDVKKG
jgi:purine-nucleoside phosphorylase